MPIRISSNISFGYSVLFLLLIFQYLLIYVFGDVFYILDDLSVILLLPIFLISLRSNNTVLLLSLVYLIFKTILFVFIEFRLINAVGDLFLYYLKPIVIFWSFYFIFENLSQKRLVRLKVIIEYVFYFAVAYGLVQFVAWFFFRLDMPMRSSKYFGLVESGSFDLLRVSSFFGQPLWFGYFSTLFGIYFILKRQYLKTLLALIGVLLTFSRWALFLFFLLSTIIIFSRLPKKKRIFFFSTAVALIIFFIPIIIPFYERYWGNYNEKAIKMYGIRKATELILHNPWGYGLGSYGTTNSIGSITYKLSDFDNSRLNNLSERKTGIESFVFISLVQIGFDGLLFFMAPFFKRLRKHSDANVFLYFLIILPLFDIYINLLLITSSFLFHASKHK